MRLFVTGANGFLGRAIVARAVERGHDVVALVRAGKPVADELLASSAQVVTGDLRSGGEWQAQLTDTDVVVHAAAASGGPRSIQLANTVVATERLLEALAPSPPSRLVLVSSLSVYDFDVLPVGAALDESTPLHPRPHERDAYTEAKTLQEELVRRWCTTHEVPCVVLRPGAIVGPGKHWDFGAALTTRRFAAIVSPRSAFRLVSLSTCADAIVRAAEIEAEGIEIVNLVDDDPPSHATYFRRCRAAGATDRIAVPVPWRMLDAAGRLLHTLSRVAFDGRLRTPELLDHRRQAARWKPLRYPNDRAHRVLGWPSDAGHERAIASIATSGDEGGDRG